jgi:HEPN domain-containing protein
MLNRHYAPWEQYPKYLSQKEVQHPISVIDDFFSADRPKGHKKRLKEWRHFAVAQAHYTNKRFGPGSLLYTCELNLKLLEAMFLLLINYESSFPKPTIPNEDQLKKEKEEWPFFPKNLSDQEILNPFKAIRKIFKELTLAEYRDHLNEWLSEALTIKTTAEGIDAADILLIYESMLRLHSAAWLILQRSATEPPLKKTVESAPDKQQPKTTPLKVNTFHDVALYDLNISIPAIGEGQLSGLIAIIKHKISSVQAVIYLGAIPNEPNTVFLLILTNNEEKRQAQSLSSTIEESCREVVNVVALVHHASAFLSGLQHDHLFFNKALRCPIVYLSGDLLLPSYKTQLPSGTSETGLANWEHWRKQGKDFLEGAEGYLKREATPAALFSLHQCVECLLVAIIRVVLGYRVNNHNLATLLRISRMFTGSLIEIFNLDAAEDARLFDVLKHAYVNVRYKDRFEPNTNDVDTLYQVTKYFVSATETVYQKYLLTSNL